MLKSINPISLTEVSVISNTYLLNVGNSEIIQIRLFPCQFELASFFKKVNSYWRKIKDMPLSSALNYEGGGGEGGVLIK